TDAGEVAGTSGMSSFAWILSKMLPATSGIHAARTRCRFSDMLVIAEVLDAEVKKMEQRETRQPSCITFKLTATVWNDVTQQLEELKQRAEELGHRVDEL
ncbi:hypothetical protein Tco_1079039, partial [Tanacetum coccineum]